MSQYIPKHHDYRIGDIRYDARVVDAGGACLQAAKADWAAFLFADDDLEQQAATDQAALQAIFDARVRRIHQLVTWSQLDGRAVCTCGLTLPSPELLIGPNGHRDQRWTYEGAYVAQIDAGTYAAACQRCRQRTSATHDLDSARTWTEQHTCLDRTTPADAADTPANENGVPVPAPSKIVDETEVIRWI